MSSILTQVFIVGLLTSMVRISTPILLAAMGELVNQRAGIINLGMEGIIMMGSFFGFIGAYITGNLWVGVAAAIVGGALLGLLMGFLSVTLGADQAVAGIGINMLSAGLSFYAYRVYFSEAGYTHMPSVPTFEVVKLPFLSEIPILGPVLFSHHWMTYVAFLMVPLIWFFLYRTKYGLEIRCIGDNPRAIDMKGMSIAFRQYLTLVFAGIMSGLAGGFLTLASTGLFVLEIAGGRGWIAFALVVFGNWTPSRIMLGSLFFGFLDALQLQLQAFGVQLPYQLLLSLPYLLTIVALVVMRSQSQQPLHLAQPYAREHRLD